ncbi:MAG: iron-containing alcohol dehydrogenase, partial [Clostridiales Family XIII bacterium]|nr:iron-containing alcohol dehydrogenase [Clostridiales Family XIII bacterium]
RCHSGKQEGAMCPMINFDYKNPTRLIFGKDAHRKIGEYLKPYAAKVLLHYGGGSIKSGGIYDDVTQSLSEAGVGYVELGGVKPNPRIDLVNEGVALARGEGVDLVLAVGGGSVIDSAKAIGVGALYDGELWDLFENYTPVSKTMPVATVLTFPAAGSESSNGCVITNEAKSLKKSYDHELNRPLLSVINPELFSTVPKNQIAYALADMMSHVFERYFTYTPDTGFTDRLCEAVLGLLMDAGPRLLEKPDDYALWSEVALAGNMAQNGQLGVGRIPDWASHMLEHELSAVYDVPHGAGLAVLMPAWMKYVYKNNVGMFLQFAVKVMGVELKHDSPEATIEEAIEKLKTFFRSLGLPVSLKDMGIDDSNFELMSKRASGEAWGKQLRLGGILSMGTQDALEVFKLALE